MRKILILVVLLFSIYLSAQVPQLIDYQGRLADSDGNYLNGVVTIQFSTYDVATSGISLWSESQDVSISNGIFHVLLGSIQSFPSGMFDDPVIRQLGKPVVEEKGTNAICEKGELLYPEAYGYPESRGKDYRRIKKMEEESEQYRNESIPEIKEKNVK